MGPFGGGLPVLGSVGGQTCASIDNWFRNQLSGSSRHTHHNSPIAGSHGIFRVVPCTQHPYGVPRGVVISWSSGTRSSMGPNLGFDRKFPQKSSFDTHNTPTTGVKARWHVSNQSWWVPSMELWGHSVVASLCWAPNWVKHVHRLINGSEPSLVVHPAIPTTTHQVQVAA